MGSNGVPSYTKVLDSYAKALAGNYIAKAADKYLDKGDLITDCSKKLSITLRLSVPFLMLNCTGYWIYSFSEVTFL